MICWFALMMASLIHAYNLVWVATRLSEATVLEAAFEQQTLFSGPRPLGFPP